MSKERRGRKVVRDEGHGQAGVRGDHMIAALAVGATGALAALTLVATSAARVCSDLTRLANPCRAFASCARLAFGSLTSDFRVAALRSAALVATGLGTIDQLDRQRALAVFADFEVDADPLDFVRLGRVAGASGLICID